MRHSRIGQQSNDGSHPFMRKVFPSFLCLLFPDHFPMSHFPYLPHSFCFLPTRRLTMASIKMNWNRLWLDSASQDTHWKDLLLQLLFQDTSRQTHSACVLPLPLYLPLTLCLSFLFHLSSSSSQVYISLCFLFLSVPPSRSLLLPHSHAVQLSTVHYCCLLK